jgi:hypothetical protein
VKVFISWSGVLSQKVAEVLKDWIPSVIQAIEPFLSSEDIDKGNRWNTDIARELKETSFGIICVTKENLSAQWLNFEAGALSKMIENTHVAPFLVDVKPSDLGGSPMSQFQATSFDVGDVRKLVQTLNTACVGSGSLAEQHLEKAFLTWWPQLEERLRLLIDQAAKGGGQTKRAAGAKSPQETEILEEVLESSRNTQRLLGNTDTRLQDDLGKLQEEVAELVSWARRQHRRDAYRSVSEPLPLRVDDLLVILESNVSSLVHREGAYDVGPYVIPILLSPFKNRLPWLYDAGWHIATLLMADTHAETLQQAVARFWALLELVADEFPGTPLGAITEDEALAMQKLLARSHAVTKWFLTGRFEDHAAFPVTKVHLVRPPGMPDQAGGPGS